MRILTAYVIHVAIIKRALMVAVAFTSLAAFKWPATPNFITFLTWVTHNLTAVKVLQKKSMWEDFRADVLNFEATHEMTHAISTFFTTSLDDMLPMTFSVLF